MYNIFTLNNISPKGLILLDDKYSLVDEINDAHGILVRSHKMHDMELPENLMAIGRAGAGTNNIPLEACADKGIVVFNTPGANANAVKELTIASILMASRNIPSGINWVNGLEKKDVGAQVEKGKKAFVGTEIKGKTLAVIGLGAIGVMVANAASALGMKVVGYDPYISVKSALDLSRKIKLCQDLNTVVSEAHYVTIHVPFMKETTGMINSEVFSNMKEGASLLNFSRGEIVHDEDLIKALEMGIVANYVTDFPNDMLLGKDKVISVPHLGASSEESEENCAIMAVEELKDYFENGNITNSVNYPNCALPPSKMPGRVAVLHKNIPSILGNITNAIGQLGANIEELNNRSKGAYAYTLIDMDQSVTESQLSEVMKFEGVISVRVVK